MESFDQTGLIALVLALVVFFGIYYLKKNGKINFGGAVITATVFGIIFGLCFKGHVDYVSLFGVIFVNCLTALVVPLLFFSIFSSITNLDTKISFGKIGGKALFYLLLNVFLAAVVTVLVCAPMHLGSGFNYVAATGKLKEIPPVTDTIVALFPKNFAQSWVDNQVIPIILFSVLLAVLYNKNIGKEPSLKIFKQFMDAASNMIGKAIGWVIQFTPYAVFSLIARAVSRSTIKELLPLISVLIIVYLLCIFQILVIQGGLLKFAGHFSPMKFLKGMWQAFVVTFTTQSSIGTAPVTIDCLVHNLGVDENVASFTIGLGANVGMPGCAGIWSSCIAICAANMLGVHFTIAQYVFMVVMIVLISLGTVGVPGSAIVTATALFTSLGLPAEMVLFFSPISSIADMMRTATNVLGAAEAATIVASQEDMIHPVDETKKKVPAAAETKG